MPVEHGDIVYCINGKYSYMAGKNYVKKSLYIHISNEKSSHLFSCITPRFEVSDKGVLTVKYARQSKYRRTLMPVALSSLNLQNKSIVNSLKGALGWDAIPGTDAENATLLEIFYALSEKVKKYEKYVPTQEIVDAVMASAFLKRYLEIPDDRIVKCIR